MSRSKPKYAPDPRVWTDYQLACRFDKGEGWFRDHRPKLEAEGFPKYDELLGGTDSHAVEAWFDKRSRLTTKASNDDPGLDQKLREMDNG